MKLNAPRLLALLVGTFLQAASAAPTMYIANNGSDTMFAVDVGALTSTTIGAAGVNLGFGGLGFAGSGQLYGWTTGAGLHTVNTSTGAWTAVAGPAGVPCGDTFDVSPTSGVAHVVNICTGQLHTVNLATAATAAGPMLTGWATGAGSAFGEDGALYFIDSDGSDIRRTDVATGITTIVGATGVATGSITNLAYNPDDDMLYAVGLSDAQLYRFNPLTGAGTALGLIAGLPTGGQITMATFDVAGAAVPEPAGLALALTALSLLAFARRRRPE